MSIKLPARDLTVPVLSRPPKKRVANAFGLKASTYDAHAILQKQIVNRLVPKIVSCKTENDLWADLGCGTGLFSRALDDSSVKLRLIGMDLASGPLFVMKGTVPVVQGDIESMPFKACTFDGVVISSVLQWLDDPLEGLKHIAEIIRPAGHVVFSVFVTGSFFELFETRARFQMNIPVTCCEPGLLFETFRTVSFEHIESEEVQETIYFPDALSLLKSVGKIGGTATEGKRLTRSELGQFCEQYEAQYRTNLGVPLTWRTLIGVCKKGSSQ